MNAAKLLGIKGIWAKSLNCFFFLPFFMFMPPSKVRLIAHFSSKLSIMFFLMVNELLVVSEDCHTV